MAWVIVSGVSVRGQGSGVRGQDLRDQGSGIRDQGPGIRKDMSHAPAGARTRAVLHVGVAACDNVSGMNRPRARHWFRAAPAPLARACRFARALEPIARAAGSSARFARRLQERPAGRSWQSRAVRFAVYPSAVLNGETAASQSARHRPSDAPHKSAPPAAASASEPRTRSRARAAKSPARRTCTPALHVQPVGKLHQKHVVRRRCEDAAEVAPELKSPSVN